MRRSLVEYVSWNSRTYLCAQVGPPGIAQVVGLRIGKGPDVAVFKNIRDLQIVIDDQVDKEIYYARIRGTFRAQEILQSFSLSET